MAGVLAAGHAKDEWRDHAGKQIGLVAVMVSEVKDELDLHQKVGFPFCRLAHLVGDLTTAHGFPTNAFSLEIPSLSKRIRSNLHLNSCLSPLITKWP